MWPILKIYVFNRNTWVWGWVSQTYRESQSIEGETNTLVVFGLYMRFIDKIRNTQYSPYYPLTHRGACNPLTVIKITKLELWGFQTASVFYLCWGGGYYSRHLHFYFGKMTETLLIYHGFVLYMFVFWASQQFYIFCLHSVICLWAVTQ